MPDQYGYERVTMNDIAELFGLFIGFCLVIGIPLAAILTSHQRKMSEMIHKDQTPAQQDEILRRLDSLQHQMSEMQNRQNELILEKQDRPTPPNVAERMRG